MKLPEGQSSSRRELRKHVISYIADHGLQCPDFDSRHRLTLDPALSKLLQGLDGVDLFSVFGGIERHLTAAPASAPAY